MKNKYILGIDTSNYKTSIAVTNQQQNVVCDLRKFLNVKQGEKGLRQSDALFQHVKNLPELMEQIMSQCPYQFAAISCSSKPRPLKDSYMPVFLAGESYGRMLSAALDIPLFKFSHQEGHIEAIKAFSKCKAKDKLLACHFSGGTSELLCVTNNNAGYNIEIIGGSKDIAFGQVIDRAGVDLGMKFPAGEEMDKLALNTADKKTKLLTPIKVKDAWLNLSGIDTQVKRILAESEDISIAFVIRELFEKIADAMVKMVSQGVEKTGITDVLMAGGVTSSQFIRNIIEDKLSRLDIHVEFDCKGLAQDNAVGIAILGGKSIWD